MTLHSVVAECPDCARSFLSGSLIPFSAALEADAGAAPGGLDTPVELDAAFRETYTVERELGRGGMGVVVAATRRSDGRAVAIKLLDASVDETVMQRFEREAELLARLSHPNVVGFLGTGKSGIFPYLVMERVERGSLADLMAERGPMPPAEAVRLAVQILAGLTHCHEHGILHRDLKPPNVLIGSSGEPKLADLGLARAMDSATLTAAGTQLGTPRYVAPEILRGEKAGPATDVYGVALMLHECVCGRPVFPARGLATLLAKILGDPAPPLESDNPELDRAVAQALSKEPRERPPTARAFAELLERSLPAESRARPKASRPARVPAPVPAPAVVQRLAPWKSAGFGLAVGLAVVGAAAVSWSRRPAPAPTVSATATPVAVDIEPQLASVESAMVRMGWTDVMAALDQLTFAGDYVRAEAKTRDIARGLDEFMARLRPLDAASARAGSVSALLRLRLLATMLDVQVWDRRVAERVRGLARARALERTAKDDVAAWLGSIVKPRSAEESDVALIERAVSSLAPALSVAAARQPLDGAAVELLTAAAKIGVCARQLNFSTPQRRRFEARLGAARQEARLTASPATLPLADAVDALLCDARAVQERAVHEQLESARRRLLPLAAAEQVPALNLIVLKD